MNDTQKPTIAVLIVAGGSGIRMGYDTPKQYLDIHGQSIIQHTISVFEAISDISFIHCVIGEDHEVLYQQAVQEKNSHSHSFGGETRQQSVYLGLKAVEDRKPDIVLIHDAARPCVTKEDIHNLIHSMKNHEAATLAQPVTESLHKNGIMIDRNDIWIIQTPQAFYYRDILKAHKNADEGFTDDTSVYQAEFCQPVKYIACGRHNLKITTTEDLKMAEKLIPSQAMETITGSGFDVHAFDDRKADTIRLCGIDIPHKKALKGHSDADVGLHALTDAILGALADGDIGSHFPPSNNDFKNMDSHLFLDKALHILEQRKGELGHIDITLMCEEPKIGPSRTTIIHHLSNYLNLPSNRISVKATTTEKLGFTGRGEGIACQAIVTIRVPEND